MLLFAHMQICVVLVPNMLAHSLRPLFRDATKDPYYSAAVEDTEPFTAVDGTTYNYMRGLSVLHAETPQFSNVLHYVRRSLLHPPNPLSPCCPHNLRHSYNIQYLVLGCQNVSGFALLTPSFTRSPPLTLLYTLFCHFAY